MADCIVKTEGLDDTFVPILDGGKASSRLYKRLDFFKRFLGIKTGLIAFTSPVVVEIDVVFGCNLKCPFCYCFSPLTKPGGPDEKYSTCYPRTDVTEKKFLDYGVFTDIVDELSDFRVDEIAFSPAGEPFLHPDFLDMVEYVKGKGLDCTIITNGTLVDEETAERLSRLKVEIRFSLHAGDYKSWSKLQPKKNYFDFSRLKKVLKILNSENSRASVHLYGVITSLNYKDVGKLFNLAKETNSKTVILNSVICDDAGMLVPDFEQSRLIRNTLVELQEFAEKEGIGNNIENIISSPVHSKNGVLKNTPENIYVDNMSCNQGWVTARINMDGMVFPCLSMEPAGNVHKESFKRIWYSPAYNKARREMSKVNKSPEVREKYHCNMCCAAEWNQMTARQYSLSNVIKRLIRKIIPKNTRMTHMWVIS